MTAGQGTHGPPVMRKSACCRYNLQSPGHGHGEAQAARTPAAEGGQRDPAAPARVPGPRAAAPSAGPSYHGMLAVDIKGFNDPARDHEIRRSLRVAMYELLAGALNRSGLPWSSCYHEDRGDGVLVIAPAGAPAMALLYPFAEYLRAGIRRHNRFRVEAAQIRLRTAVHAGQVSFDGHGVSGDAVTHLFRMLEAPAFKRALDASGAHFALVTSDCVFREVIQPGTGLIDPDMYAPVQIRCKETRSQAWLYLPPVPNPALSSVTSQGRLRASAQLRSMAQAVSRRSASVGSALAKLSAGQDLPRPARMSYREPATG